MAEEKVIAVGTLIVNSQGQVLVLHRLATLPEGGMWGIPGGKLRENLGMLGTAKMKTELEGIACEIGELTLLNKYEYDTPVGLIEMHVYLLQRDSNTLEVPMDPVGHDSFMWEYPKVLLERTDLMVGMYPILRDYINKL